MKTRNILDADRFQFLSGETRYEFELGGSGHLTLWVTSTHGSFECFLVGDAGAVPLPGDATFCAFDGDTRSFGSLVVVPKSRNVEIAALVKFDGRDTLVIDDTPSARLVDRIPVTLEAQVEAALRRALADRGMAQNVVEDILDDLSDPDFLDLEDELLADEFGEGPYPDMPEDDDLAPVPEGAPDEPETPAQPPAPAQPADENPGT